jgi:hypothetical protein
MMRKYLKTNEGSEFGWILKLRLLGYTMLLFEADTGAKPIDPNLHARRWTMAGRRL